VEKVKEKSKEKVKRGKECQGIAKGKAEPAGSVTVYTAVSAVSASSNTDVSKAVVKTPKRGLPPGWEERESKTKKKIYFVHLKTGATTWDRPVEKNEVVKEPKKAVARSSAKSQWNKWQKTSEALRREADSD